MNECLKKVCPPAAVILIERLEKERDEIKELLSECAYSKHTQEAMDQVLFDRIQKALNKD